MVVYHLSYTLNGNKYGEDIHTVPVFPPNIHVLREYDEQAREKYREWRNKHNYSKDFRLVRLLPTKTSSYWHDKLIAANEA